MPNKPLINLKTIRKQYDLTFVEVMTIIKEEGWKTVGRRDVNFDKQIVQDYFNRKGISPKTITYKDMMKIWRIDKETVFKILAEQKFIPVSTKGAFWRFSYEPVAAFFNNPQNVYQAKTGSANNTK